MRRLERLQDGLLVVWLAFVSADRIDLIGGEGPFVLTPFLVLTPLVLLSESLRAHLSGSSVRVSRSARRYGAVLLALLAVVVVSAFFARDRQTAALRTAHLAFLAVSTLGVGVLLVDRPRLRRVLVRGAKAVLALSLVFSVGQVLAWFGAAEDTLRLGPATVSVRASDYAGFVPRLSGPVADQNRAGLLYLFALFVLARWGRPGPGRRGWLILGGALLLATLSRSALLGVLATALVAGIERREVRVSRSAALAGCAAVAVLVGWLLVSPTGRAEAVHTLEPLSGRLSVEEGSARSHLALLGRGAEVGSSSVEHAAVGIGYGNAYLVLQDFFPGNRYGNFHSLYVTMFAEAGIPALLLVLLLLAVPLVRGSPFRPLVAGVVFLNLFYQFAAEPIFWLVLALAWIMIDRHVEPMRRTLRSRAVAPLLALGLLASGGCADWIVDANEYGTVEVNVTRRSGEGVPGALVILFTGERHEARGETGVDGRVVFGHVPTHLPDRGYGVRVHPPQGWVFPEILSSEPIPDVVTGIRVDEGDRETASFTLVKRGPGAVEAEVRGPEGEPVVGAELSLYRPSVDFQEFAVTGADGRARFDPVPFGKYGLRVWAPPEYETEDGRRQTFVEGILVEEGVTETVRFDLRRR